MEQAAQPAEEPATKVCPDCAETVLAAARTCRFCGYRFDLGVPQDALEREPGGLFAIFRRKPERPTSVPRELARWGVDLADDEQPVGLWVGSVDASAGFLAVTDVRMIFVENGLSRQRSTHKVRSRLLRDVVRAEPVRVGWRHALEVEWSDRSTERIQLATKSRPAFLAALQAGMSRRAAG